MRGEEARLLREGVARFARNEVAPTLEAFDHDPTPRGDLRWLAGLGTLGLLDLDTDYMPFIAVALEALAAPGAAAATMVLAHTVARVLTARNPGGLGAFPLYAEPEETRVVVHREGGRAELGGESRLVVNAPIADWLHVPARDGDQLVGAHVEVGAGGVRIGDPLLTLGMRGCPVADVRLDGAPAVIRPFDDALLEAFRGPSLAIGAGLAMASHETAHQYAQERRQGGEAIVDHPQVRVLLADCRADAALSTEAAVRLSSREPCDPPHATGLFLRAREAAARATRNGVQVLGGYGYVEDYGQARRMRDARQAAVLLGRGPLLRQHLGAPRP